MTSSKDQESLLAVNDEERFIDQTGDDETTEAIIAEGNFSNSTNNTLTKPLSSSLDDFYFVLSPRMLATSLCHQLMHCCCSILRLWTSIFQRLNASHVSIPHEPKQQKSFKIHFSLDFERMYVGFAVLFILHYFYLLRIVLCRNTSSEQLSRSRHQKRDELLFTLEEVVEEEEEDDSDSEKEWADRMGQEERYEEQFENLVGRELLVVYSKPLVSNSSCARALNGTGGAQKLSSVATATTMDAFSFLEDSDDEHDSSSSSSSSEHSFPSQYAAAADWYYYQEEVQDQQQINKECEVVLR